MKYTLWVKKDQRYVSFITMLNVGRFSKFFHLWIHQEICNKTLSCFLPQINCVATLPCKNIKCHFYHFITRAVTKTYNRFNFQRNNVSTQWACTASRPMSVSRISDFWNWGHPRLLNQACGSSTQMWTSKLQHLYRNSVAGLPQKSSQRERNIIMVWLAWLWATHHHVSVKKRHS